MPEDLTIEKTQGAPIPADEEERLKALRDLEILDTDPEDEFDRITRVARIIFGTRMAALSLVDEHRQWFKSITGLNAEETPRSQAFCAHTILEDSQLVVLNAEADERFAENPLVTGQPSIRFYAGAPLKTSSGARVGSLCVIDTKPRENWSLVEAGLLKDLAELVASAMKSRQERKDHQRVIEELRTLRAQVTPDFPVDQLTGLPDRRAVEMILTQAKSAADKADRFVALIYIDLDNISSVNDKYGETAGDQILKVLAARFRNAFRKNDFVLRIAGDQFLVVLQGLEFTNGVERPVKKLLQVAAEAIKLDSGGELAMSVSAGVAYYPHCGSTALELLTEAKNAMLAAKEAGGNICAVNVRCKEMTFISAQ